MRGSAIDAVGAVVSSAAQNSRGGRGAARVIRLLAVLSCSAARRSPYALGLMAELRTLVDMKATGEQPLSIDEVAARYGL